MGIRNKNRTNSIKFVTLREFDDRVKKLATKEEVQNVNATLPYKSLILMMTQAGGTVDPTINVLLDEIGLDISSSLRIDAGRYLLYFADPVIDINKTHINISTINIGTARAYVVTPNSINVETYKYTSNLTTGEFEATPIDGYLMRCMVEIKLFN